MAAGGFDDILITFPLVGTGKAERLAELAVTARIVVGADSEVVARELSSALRSQRRERGLSRRLRHGLRSDRCPDAGGCGRARRVRRETAKPRVRRPDDASGGHREQATGCARRAPRSSAAGSPSGASAAAALHTRFTSTRAASSPSSAPARTSSATGVWRQTASCPLEDCALRVVSTVVSRPTPDRAILDAGSKTLSSDGAAGIRGRCVRARRRVSTRCSRRPFGGARNPRPLRMWTPAGDRRSRHDRPEPRLRRGQPSRPGCAPPPRGGGGDRRHPGARPCALMSYDVREQAMRTR